MRASGGSLMRRCVLRLKAAMRDDGERCHRCGVCHNVCGLMGRAPGWLHRGAARSGGATDAISVMAHRPHSIDAKVQEG